MRSNYTHISIVLDRSGSMASCATDTIGGFNTFLRQQQDAPGDATLTMAQFDTVYEVLQSAKAIKEVPPLSSTTFVPRGSTALLDAIGRTVVDTGAFLGTLDESARPEKVVFVVITDGMENASCEFTQQQINDMITHQREVYRWEFVFLGANQDAISAGVDLGVAATASMTYAANGAGSKALYDSVSANLVSYRSGAVQSMSFTKEDRLKQQQAGVKDDPLASITTTGGASSPSWVAGKPRK